MGGVIGQWVTSGGILIVLALMLINSCGVPFPSEVIMPVAGVLAATGHFNIVAVIVAGVAGNLIGALIARRRATGATVGVLSVDPTSPFSGGAVSQRTDVLTPGAEIHAATQAALTDPLFTNAAGGDYTLRLNSPAFTVGFSTSGVPLAP